MVERDLVAEVSKQIVDTMPSEGQCLITRDGQTFLLSVSATVGEKGACKIWIQGRDAIKVDSNGPLGGSNQLIFRGRVLDNPPTFGIIERHGYYSIEPGQEVGFLKELLDEGEMDWRDDDRQSWASWIGLE